MFDKVKKILLKYTETTNIEPQCLLGADLGFSSFDVISIIVDLEEEFHVEFSDRDIGGFVCVNDILEYLKAHCDF